jgi:hypothetical protein
MMNRSLVVRLLAANFTRTLALTDGTRRFGCEKPVVLGVKKKMNPQPESLKNPAFAKSA